MKYAVGFVLAMLLLPAHRAQAGPIIVSLSSPNANLNSLPIGGTAVFDVEVAGLMAGDQLEFLGVTVDYPSALLGGSMVSAGGIVPDIDGFTNTPNGTVGFAGGLYDVINFGGGPDYAPITANGVFYSFSVQATETGTGVVSLNGASFVFSGTTASDGPLSGGIDPSHSSLSFTVTNSPPSAAVPAPPSLLLLAVGVALVAVRAGASRSRAPKPVPRMGRDATCTPAEPGFPT